MTAVLDALPEFLFGAACLVLGLALGFLAGTGEVRGIRRGLDALGRRLREGQAEGG